MKGNGKKIEDAGKEQLGSRTVISMKESIKKTKEKGWAS